MAFHHVALATNDMAATHTFYTEAMGFELVKSVVAPTEAGGWAKHLFYATSGSTGDGSTGNGSTGNGSAGGSGGELLAFWDLHDPTLEPVRPAISEDLGLPIWVNHLAFYAQDLTDLNSRKDRWLDHGVDVMEIDHGFCRSMYTVDPNRILVEWCCDTAPYTEADKVAAMAALHDPQPHLEAVPEPVFHEGRRPAEGDGSVTDPSPTPSSPSEPLPAGEPVPAT